ncbi:sigma-54-dependent Fis family transcriptional regulator [Chitinophaga silvisoli]|uniref:AAA family ATPase n=1 Tax=Chitinophaga silvisoli TaxID=2291814 RepID=A0A3E1P9S3_9BACT|nr:sigma 54-interacting transcriptional regulator [Chitinophaga silvisoli]RFM36945.1 AAA family ATPase [Chitinophaga silvisoli]
MKQGNMMVEFLLSLSSDIALIRDKDDFLRVLRERLREVIHFNDIVINIFDEDGKSLVPYLYYSEGRRKNHPAFQRSGHSKLGGDQIFEAVMAAEQPQVFNVRKLLKVKNHPAYIPLFRETGIVEFSGIRLRTATHEIGCLFLFSEQTGTFPEPVLQLIKGVSHQLSIVLANMLANDRIASQLKEIEIYRQRLENKHPVRKKEIAQADLVGNSREMQQVFRLISQVAPADSTVLILGETGTGKELVSKAIHNHSTRRDKLLVKVNCAALPVNLIESELFGHEKGAFTGASERRIGKFEMAHGGTLLLDEIGELPLELQAKLLRVLQEREIERIGGKSPVRIDVRIIAATNRDLKKEVEAGRFRRDLFYRLNVFPIVLPPLRERKDEIPELAEYFLQRYAGKAGKSAMRLADGVKEEMMAYHWPGNVRELEHLIERSVLLSRGTVIEESFIRKSH